MRGVIRGTSRVALAAALIAIVFFSHRGLATSQVHRIERSSVPDPALARLLSFGFHSLASDLFWLQLLQTTGGSRVDTTRRTQASQQFVDLQRSYLDVVIELDPWASAPYRFAAVFLVDREESVHAANEILDRGIQYHPEDWRLLFYKGFNSFYYLEQNKEAADYMEAAARLPGSPSYLPRLVARLRSEEGASLEMAEQLMRSFYEGATGEREKRQYAQAMLELDTERLARLLDIAREEYIRRNGRDIVAVEDLLGGPRPVLGEIPPEPHGTSWILGPKGEIVSSELRRRYELFGRPALEKNRARRLEAMRSSLEGEK